MTLRRESVERPAWCAARRRHNTARCDAPAWTTLDARRSTRRVCGPDEEQRRPRSHRPSCKIVAQAGAWGATISSLHIHPSHPIPPQVYKVGDCGALHQCPRKCAHEVKERMRRPRLASSARIWSLGLVGRAAGARSILSTSSTPRGAHLLYHRTASRLMPTVTLHLPASPSIHRRPRAGCSRPPAPALVHALTVTSPCSLATCTAHDVTHLPLVFLSHSISSPSQADRHPCAHVSNKHIRIHTAHPMLSMLVGRTRAWSH